MSQYMVRGIFVYESYLLRALKSRIVAHEGFESSHEASYGSDLEKSENNLLHAPCWVRVEQLTLLSNDPLEGSRVLGFRIKFSCVLRYMAVSKNRGTPIEAP